MSAFVAELLPVWLLLVGSVVVGLGRIVLKSATTCGQLALLWIVLAGVALHPAVGSWLVGEVESTKRTARSADLADDDSQARRESALPTYNIKIASIRKWRIAWQLVILPTAFLTVLMTLGNPAPRRASFNGDNGVSGHRHATDNDELRYALLLCSAAGLCGCACSRNLWWLFIAGRLCVWPWLLAFRECESSDLPVAEEKSIGRRLASIAFWQSLKASLQTGTPSAEEPPTRSPALVLLMMREFWSMLLMLAGLGILAYWTKLPALSLDDLLEFNPGKEASSGWGIAGVLLAIAGAGWTIPLHFETLDIAERADSMWSVWFISIQIVASVLTVCALLVHSTLGRVVSADTMLLVFAGWSFIIGSLVTRRQIHLRRWLAGLAIAQSGWWMTSVALAVAQQKMGMLHPQSRSMFPENLSVTIYLVVADLTSIVGFVAVCRYFSTADRELNYLDELRGVFRQQPGGATCAGICLLSILGVPMTAGFWSRWQLMAGIWNVELIQSGSGFPMVHGGFFALACLLIFTQGIEILAILQPLRLMFIERPIGRIQPEGGDAALSAALLATFVIVGVGLLPDALLRELLNIVAP